MILWYNQFGYIFFAKIAIYIAINHDKIYLLMFNDFKTNGKVGVQKWILFEIVFKNIFLKLDIYLALL